ncbi:MAG: hypothetical protein ACXVBY_12885, partial [Isosphaeraceae bacterium]
RWRPRRPTGRASALLLDQPGADRGDPNAHRTSDGCVAENVHNGCVVGDEAFAGIESASAATFANR